MKNLIAVAAFAGIIGTTQAASVTINNITGSGQDLAFADLNGTPLVSGFVAIYSFTSDLPSTAADLQAIGTSGLLGIATFDSSNGINSPDAGSFTLDFNIDRLASAVDLYVVIGNGANVEGSGNLALLNSMIQLPALDPENPDNFSPTYNAQGTAANEVIIGSVNRGDVNWGNTISTSYTTNILSLAAVPEPSSTLLLGIGLLAAGARRRR